MIREADNKYGFGGRIVEYLCQESTGKGFSSPCISLAYIEVHTLGQNHD
jgi:hypothetical protein